MDIDTEAKQNVNFVIVIGFKINLKSYLGGKDMLTGCSENNMRKQCKQCKEAFDAKDEFDLFCSKECKEEALAELDSDSDECLSCQ